MRNLEISFVFNQIADLLEIQGANPFRVRAYRRAALNIEGLADNIETLSLQGTLRNVPGIGEDLANKIDEYLRTGTIAFHEELKKEVPPGLHFKLPLLAKAFPGEKDLVIVGDTNMLNSLMS